MAWIPAAIAAGGSLAGAYTSSKAADKASKDQAQAGYEAMRIQQAQQRQNRQDLYPWISAGKAALAEQRKQLGLAPEAPQEAAATTVAGGDESAYKKVPGGGPQDYYDPRTGQGYALARKGANAGQFVRVGQQYDNLIEKPAANPTFDPNFTPTTSGSSGGSRYGAFETSPGYQFALDEGTKAVERQGAAKGRSFSGASLRQATRYAAGLASTEYDNYYKRLEGMSGTGSSTGGQLGNQGVLTASNAGSSAAYAGASRASGVAAKGDIWGNTIGELGGVFADYWANRQQPKPAVSRQRGSIDGFLGQF